MARETSTSTFLLVDEDPGRIEYRDEKLQSPFKSLIIVPRQGIVEEFKDSYQISEKLGKRYGR
ncbi:MAG: hypothetical protein ACK401_04795 [Archaeoglobaceae archaeon]